ncbi:MAG: FecR domain-containing protein, partial [Solimonas sp.]
ALDAAPVAGKGTTVAAPSPLRERASPAMRPARRHRRFAFAAAAMVSVALVALLPQLRLLALSDYRTGTGERRELALPDGSRLQLDAGSAVAVDFQPRRRAVRVLSGRAFFDVARDPARPFSVEAGGLRITDIGTAFEVGRDAGAVSVAVESGIVDVEAGGARLARLLAGQRLAVDSEAPAAAQRDAVAPALIASWRRGRLVIDDQSIASIADRLRAYAPGVIVVMDRRLAAQRVSGSYALDDPAAALQAAVQPYGGRVRRLTPFLLIVAAGAAA